MKAIRTFALAATLCFCGVYDSQAAKLTATQQAAMIDALMQELQMCWNLPMDEKPRTVKVKFFLLKSGTLDGEPVVMAPHPDAKKEEASAIRAVKRCSPFKSVTQYTQAFDDWREIIVTFDPEEIEF